MQAAVIRDLDRLRETVLELQGKRFAARTRACGQERWVKIVSCVGVRLPPAVRREAGGSA